MSDLPIGRWVRIAEGAFDRWYIFHPENPLLAWSGSRWVDCHEDGTPGCVQVCNFATLAEAAQYAVEHLGGIVKAGK